MYTNESKDMTTVKETTVTSTEEVFILSAHSKCRYTGNKLILATAITYQRWLLITCLCGFVSVSTSVEVNNKGTYSYHCTKQK